MPPGSREIAELRAHVKELESQLDLIRFIVSMGAPVRAQVVADVTA